MFKSRVISFMKYNKFEFGDQPISQFVVFECKYLFSIIIFYFHKANGVQERFHTHAFNAFSVKLFGNYIEYVLLDEKTGHYKEAKRNKIFKWFPRNSYHMIGNSTGCCTILFSGPWKKTWKEYVDKKVMHYSWGRKQKR